MAAVENIRYVRTKEETATFLEIVKKHKTCVLCQRAPAKATKVACCREQLPHCYYQR